MPSGGIRAGAGRPLGALTILSEPIKKALLETFKKMQQDRDANLLEWAKSEPTQFYKLICSLLPVDLHIQNQVTFGDSQINISKDGDKISLSIKDPIIGIDIPHTEL